MVKTLQDLCKDAKDRQNLTIQDLSDMTDISASTISNFFSASSKEPSVYKMGLICAALGVSMDEYFGIEKEVTTEDQLTKANEQLKHQKQLHDADVQIAHLEGSMEQMAKTINYHRKKSRDTKFAIYGLTFLCAIFMAVIVGYIFFDYRIPPPGAYSGRRGQHIRVDCLFAACGRYWLFCRYFDDVFSLCKKVYIIAR